MFRCMTLKLETAPCVCFCIRYSQSDFCEGCNAPFHQMSDILELPVGISMFLGVPF